MAEAAAARSAAAARAAAEAVAAAHGAAEAAAVQDADSAVEAHQTTGVTGASPKPVTPRHSINVRGELQRREAVVLVDLPGVRGMRELNVDLSVRTIQISGPGYELRAELPLHADVARASAKFSTKSSQLRVVVPESL